MPTDLSPMELGLLDIIRRNPGISSDRLNEEMWNALERIRQADLVDEGSDEYNFSTYRLKDPVE